MQKKSLVTQNTIKIIVTGCIAIIISLVVMGLISIAITQKAVTTKLKKSDLNYMAKAIASSIESKVAKAIETSLLFTDDTTVGKWVKSSENDLESKVVTVNKMKQIADELGYDTVFLTSAITGNYWSYSKGKLNLIDKVSKNDPNDIWFFNSIKMNKKYEINIDYNKELNNTYVWINVLMGELRKPVAVAGIGLDLKKVIDGLNNDDELQGIKSMIWMVNNKGIIYLSKDKNYLGKSIKQVLKDKIAGNILNQSNTSEDFLTSEYYDSQNILYDVAYRSIEKTDWKLIIQIPRSESIGFLSAVIANIVLAGIIIIVIIIILFNVLTNRIANPYKTAIKLNEELELKISERTLELRKSNEQISESIRYAKIIQESIMPTCSTMKEIFKEHFIIWKPRDIVGGDFYWSKKYNDGTVFAVCDCTGHGVSGALITSSVNAILNQIIDETNYNNPAGILNELDIEINKSFHTEEIGLSIRNGLDAAIICLSKKGITYCGARISVYMSIDNGIIEIKANRASIDGNPKKISKNFENYECKIQEEANIYIATDGFTDQIGGEKKLPFGKKRLINELQAVQGFSMNEQGEVFQNMYAKYVGSEEQRDDVTLIGIKYSL
jgi:serine phosphatase RsbU (regulator of sigma subunit)